jgi:hypothetical protein
MERRRRAVEPDIGDEIAALRDLIEPGQIGAMMQKAALDERAQKVGLGTKITGHGTPSAKGSRHCSEGARSPRTYIYEEMRFRGKGAAMQWGGGVEVEPEGRGSSDNIFVYTRKPWVERKAAFSWRRGPAARF